MRSWGFVHEIQSGKWVMNGLFISQIAKLYYGVFEYYFLYDMSLI
jgi:hypothetical protein